MLSLNIFLPTILFLILGVRIHVLNRERNSLKSTIEYLKLENFNLENNRTKNHELYKCMESYTGGVIKRIDEIREITEAIYKHSPETFKKEPGLICWLSASDQFLTKLVDIYAPPGSNPYFDSKRAIFFANGRNGQIYSKIDNNPLLKRQAS